MTVTSLFQKFAQKVSMMSTAEAERWSVWNRRWEMMQEHYPERTQRMRLVSYVLLDGSVAQSEAMGATTFGTLYIMAPPRARYVVTEMQAHEFWVIDLQDAVVGSSKQITHDEVGVGWRKEFPDQDSATMYAIMAATTVTKGDSP